MLKDGKQIRDSSIPDAKMVVAYTKADGTRAFTGDQSLGMNKITNVADGVGDNDAPNFAQLKAYSIGLRYLKDPVEAIQLTNVADLATGAPDTADGVSLQVGDRIGLVFQTTGSEKGIYVVDVVGTGANGTWSRSTDTDEDAEVKQGMRFWVNEGTVHGNSGFVLTTDDPIIVGTTALSFTKYTGLGLITAGAGLAKTGNVLDIGDVNKGVQVNANDLEVAGNEVASAGLEQDATNSWQIRIAAAAAGNGLTGGAGSPLSVQVVNGSINVAAGGIKSAVPVEVDKARAPAATSGDFANAQLAITKTPAGDGYVAVFVNGTMYKVGDGIRTGCDCYFSNDAGATARAIDAITAGDGLRWNGVIAGFDLATSDRVDFMYEHVVPA